MALTTDDYLQQLRGLLPPGPAWPRDAESLLTEILSAFSEEFARVDERVDELLNEADPRTASELLPDWERVAGLPDGCAEIVTRALTPGEYGFVAADLASFARSDVGTYWDADGVMQTAAANVPRFTYDPADLTQEPKLLIEAAAMNYVARSNEFISPWGKVNSTVDDAARIGPDGEISMSALIPTASSSGHYWDYVLPTGTFEEDESVCASIFIAKGDQPKGGIQLFAESGNASAVLRFDFNAGTFMTGVSSGGSGPAVLTGFGVLPLPNGIYRIWVASTVPVNTGRRLRIYGANASDSNSYLGDGITPSIYFSDAQIVKGTEPLSYTFTNGSEVTRPADLAEIYIEQSVAQRRAALVSKLTMLGGQSRAYFIDMADVLGYPGATIDEFRPMHCNDDCNDALYSEADRFVWRINLPSDGGAFVANCQSPCDSPLQTWGDETIECRINKYKPAHTTALFAYVTE